MRLRAKSSKQLFVPFGILCSCAMLERLHQIAKETAMPQKALETLFAVTAANIKAAA